MGVAQSIGELPLFSGWWLRTLMMLTCLATLAAYICLRVVNIEFKDDQPVEMSRKLKDYALSRNNLAVLGIFLAGLVIMLFGVFIRGWYIKRSPATSCSWPS